MTTQIIPEILPSNRTFKSLSILFILTVFINFNTNAQLNNPDADVDNQILALAEVENAVNKSVVKSVDKNDLILTQSKTKDKICLKSKNYQDEILSVFISDDLGKEISFMNVKLKEDQTEIDLNGINTGRYLVSVFNSHGKILRSNQLIVE